MDFSDAGFILTAYWISNAVGLIFLFVAFRWTRLARLMFALLFGYAAFVNYNLSHTNPSVYLEYASHAVGFYAAFIRGWFGDHITIFVSCIAAGQLLIAVGMILRRAFVTIACVGAIVFLMAIAPLGLYAAFPFSITVSVAAWLILRRDRKEYLWTGSAVPSRKPRQERLQGNIQTK
jgi:hypothetical protein